MTVGIAAAVGSGSAPLRLAAEVACTENDGATSTGTLTVAQPSCDAEDPGLDATLMVEGADAAVRFIISADDGTPVQFELGYPYTVILEKDPVTVVVTPETDDDLKLDGYDADDWTVMLGPVPEECS